MSLLPVTNFLISEWIWALSWGSYQMGIAIFFMVLLMRLIMRIGWLRALLLSFVAQLFSLLVFSFFVFGFLITLFGATYIPLDDIQERTYTVLKASLSLGLIFTLLQILFFRMLSKIYDTNYYQIVSIVFISNMIAAFCASWLIPDLF